MGRRVAARFGQAIVVLSPVATLAFVLIHAAPGDPFSVEGPNVTEAVRAHERALFGYDKPLGTQYVLWLRDLVTGNLVYSLVLGMSVPDVSGSAIANLEVESLKHPKPTYHGDTIYAETRVVEVKETSKGDRGIVTVDSKGLNRRGEEVCTFRRKVMVWKRDSAPVRHRPYDESIWDGPDA